MNSTSTHPFLDRSYKTVCDFLKLALRLTLPVGAISLLLGFSLYVSNWLYPNSPWHSADSSFTNRLENLQALLIPDNVASNAPEYVVGGDREILHRQSRVLNWLVKAEIARVETRHGKAPIFERYFILLLFATTIFVGLMMGSFAVLGFFRRSPSSVSRVMSTCRVHWRELSVAALITTLTLGTSLCLYDTLNKDLRVELFSSPGLPFVFFGTFASVLGCFVTFIVYRTLRNRLVSWSALLHHLRKRLTLLAGQPRKGGFANDYQLDVLVYTPNPGQISFREGSRGYRLFDAYQEAVGLLRQSQVPACIVCFTNWRIKRMIEKLVMTDTERNQKRATTHTFIRWLEDDVPLENKPNASAPSAISVWRHGGIPNTHFFYGGHRDSPTWCIRFLIHRELNGSKHEIGGFETEDGVEIEFGQEVFREYLHEVASPLEADVKCLPSNNLTLDLIFYAQSGVSRLRIYASPSASYVPIEDLRIAEIDLAAIPPLFLDVDKQPAAEEDAAFMRVRGTTALTRTLPHGEYFLRGEFVKAHNNTTTGGSESWCTKLIVS